jgi:DNA-binding IclR family transcriptional regulator
MGKVILAHLPPERAEHLLKANPMTARTPQTITTMAAMRQELKAIRERGYATENAENTPTSSCVAAAILDGNGFPVGAVSVSGRSLDLLMPQAQEVTGAAELIAHLL